jgi:hypothetical protein
MVAGLVAVLADAPPLGRDRLTPRDPTLRWALPTLRHLPHNLIVGGIFVGVWFRCTRVLIHDSHTPVTGVGHVRVESICAVWPIALDVP